MLGTVPHPADTDPEWNHQEWHSAGVKIKVRPQNFEDPPNTENFVAFKWSPGFLHLWEGLPINVPKNPDYDLFFKKGPMCSYIVARIYFYAHLAFQAPITSSELEIVVKWTMAAIFFSFLLYLREHTVEWFRSELFLHVMKGNKPSSQEWHPFSYKQNAGMWTFGTLWKEN